MQQSIRSHSLRVLGMVLLFAAGPGLQGRAEAQTTTARVDGTRSVLSYRGSHPIHDWIGTSRSVSGTLQIDLQDPTRSRIEIEAPVASFDSGNGLRDRRMRDLVSADQHPTVRFVGTQVAVERWDATEEGYVGAWRVRGALTFNGQTHEVVVPVSVRVRGRAFEALVRFDVSLERFHVRRPRLLGVPIRDALAVEGEVRATL